MRGAVGKDVATDSIRNVVVRLAVATAEQRLGGIAMRVAAHALSRAQGRDLDLGIWNQRLPDLGIWI